MEKVDGGQLLAKALKKEGVTKIFTLSGGHIMPIYYGCREEGIDIIDFRHECAAAYAADAYAQVTGKPGVVVTTAGPGVTDTVTAMVETRDHGVPVIHIGGASPLAENDTGALQDINTLEIMAASTKWARKIYSTKRIPEYVSMAYRHALDDSPGSVYLEVPSDILLQKVDETAVSFPEKYRTPAHAFGDPALIERAADLLLEAKTPMILIGDNARYSIQYGEAIAELSDYLKMPVAAQTMCRGMFADETQNEMFRCFYALPIADVVLMLGVNNNYQVMKLQGPLFNQTAKLIQVHTDKAKIGYNGPAEIGIVGGSGAVAKQILDHIKAKTNPKEDSTVSKNAEMFIQMAEAEWRKGFLSDVIPMNPGRCAAEVAKFLIEDKKDYTVICDGGDSSQWMLHAVKATRPNQILGFGPNGTIGVGAGFTIGAWAANQKPVLLYTGDGSLGFYIMELETMFRNGVPVVVVISNDSAWGMIKLSESHANKKRIEKVGHCAVDLVHMQDYTKLASMWGGYGVTLTDPSDIIPAIREAYESQCKPAIINVEVNKEDMSPITQMFAYGLKAE